MSFWPAQARSRAVGVPRLPRALGVWMGVNALDVLLTFYLLGIGGAEGNPMLAFALAAGGVGSLLAVKLGLALAAGLVIARMGRLALLGAASRLMSLVVVYNGGLLAYSLWKSHTGPLFG